MNEAIDRFEAYWREFSPRRPLHVHPRDAAFVRGSDLDLTLLPVPVVGDLRRAEVVILMLNPGLDAEDHSWEEREDFRDVLSRAAQHSLGDATHPFFYLDPRFANHPGAGYWIGGRRAGPGRKTQQKLRAVTQELSRRRGTTFEAIQNELAYRIAILQLLPYHSRELKRQKTRLLKTVPSCDEARALVNGLRRQDRRLIVAPRSIREWGFSGPLVNPNLVVYPSACGASASLTPRSLGGDAIIRRLSGVERS